MRAFPFGSAIEQARAIRNGAMSAVELLHAHLERVDRLNPALNCVVVDDRERALKAAKAADRSQAKGAKLGPLHGVPMTVKESFNIVGHATTWGQPALRDNIATEDALAVQRLKAAGAVVFGKTNVPINLADFQSYNEVYGTTNNPWDVTRGPGGSSGGSAAALAAGLTPLEYGSDIGGSIRNPAAYCGVYGHKPTWCIVPKRGQTTLKGPVAEADLSVIGPLARTAADLALALKVTAGPDRLTSPGLRLQLPPPPTDVRGLRVAVWDDEEIAPVDASVRAAVDRVATALRKAGAKVDRAARPAFTAAEAQETYGWLLLSQMAARRVDYDDLARTRQNLDPTDNSGYANQVRNSTASFREVYLANQRREALRWAWRAFFDRYDVLVAPITATAAFPHDHSEPAFLRTMRVDGRDVAYLGQVFWAGLATCSLLPATVVPAGKSATGLPVGVQLIGAEMADRTTIWLAGQLAQLIGGFTPPPGY